MVWKVHMYLVWKRCQKGFQHKVPGNYLLGNCVCVCVCFCISTLSITNSFLFINKLSENKHISFPFFQLQQARDAGLGSGMLPGSSERELPGRR